MGERGGAGVEGLQLLGVFVVIAGILANLSTEPNSCTHVWWHDIPFNGVYTLCTFLPLYSLA